MTILAEIVKYKQSLLQNGYYQDKLNTLKSVKIQNNHCMSLRNKINY